MLGEFRQVDAQFQKLEDKILQKVSEAVASEPTNEEYPIYCFNCLLVAPPIFDVFVMRFGHPDDFKEYFQVGEMS